MARSKTPPSTLRLSEVARHVVIPTGIVSTAWPRVVAKCAEIGVTFDEWQHGIGAIALGKRADGKYAATVGGVVLSIPRQVGKTYLVGMIVVAMCLLFPGLTVLWSAHRTRTTTKTFHTLKGMTERPKVKPLMLDPRLSNGEQELRFRNGSVIMFGAREQGFGRGFDEVDVEVFDEAQILSEKALEDMVPATNQSRQESGALLFFMGTPPRPSDPGEEFTNRRAMALSGDAEDMVYVEFSADEDADPNDRAQWAKANPSYPHRTPEESMKRMRANLTDDASFLREGLGVWGHRTASVIDYDKWRALLDPSSVAPQRFAIAFDVEPERNSAAIALFGRRPDGVGHLELVDVDRGVAWLLPRLLEVIERHAPAAVALDPSGPAGSLVPALEDAGIELTLASSRDITQACGNFYDAVNEGAFVHPGQPQLSHAVSLGRRKEVGDAWKWIRRGSDDISPLYAATLARWAYLTAEPEQPPPDPGVYVI